MARSAVSMDKADHKIAPCTPNRSAGENRRPPRRTVTTRLRATRKVELPAPRCPIPLPWRHAPAAPAPPLRHPHLLSPPPPPPSLLPPMPTPSSPPHDCPPPPHQMACPLQPQTAICRAGGVGTRAGGGGVGGGGERRQDQRPRGRRRGRRVRRRRRRVGGRTKGREWGKKAFATSWGTSGEAQGPLFNATRSPVKVLRQPCTAEWCQPISCRFALQNCRRSAQGLASRSTSDAEAGLPLTSPSRADFDLA